LNNPNAPAALLPQIWNEKYSKWLRGQLTELPIVSVILYQLSFKEHDWDEECYEDKRKLQFRQVRGELAANPSTPVEALQRFIRSNELPDFMRELAKDHPNMGKQ